MKASHVRDQMESIPTKRYRLPPGPNSEKGSRNLRKYPKEFRNKPERIPDLQSRRPWKEYPLLPGGKDVWMQTISGIADKVRGIYNAQDTSKFDVVYHDPNFSPDTRKNFRIAPYRASRRSGESEAIRDTVVEAHDTHEPSDDENGWDEGSSRKRAGHRRRPRHK